MLNYEITTGAQPKTSDTDLRETSTAEGHGPNFPFPFFYFKQAGQPSPVETPAKTNKAYQLL